MQWLYKAEPVVQRGAASVLAQLPGVSLTLRIPENLIGSRANSPPTKTQSMSVIPLFHKWMNGRGVCGGVGGRGGAHKDSEEAQ